MNTNTGTVTPQSKTKMLVINGLFMLALAGGTLGFLPFNFYPAKIFMGDGGSLFLGFMLATLSVEIGRASCRERV